MNIAIEIINAALNIYIVFLFFASFGRRSAPLWKSVLVTFSVIGGLSIALLFLKGTPIMFFINYATTLVISLLFDNKLTNKLVYSLIYFAIGSIMEMAVAILINMIFKVDFAGGKQGASFITGMLISKFVLVLFILTLRSKKHFVLSRHIKSRYYTLFLFPISTLLIEIVQHSIFLRNPSQPQSIMYFVMFGYTALTLANVFVFDVIDHICINTVNESKLIAANEIIENQTREYKHLIEHDREVIKMQHDNRHFLMGVLSDIKSGKLDSAQKSLTDACSVLNEDIVSDANVLQILLKTKSKEATDNGINIKCSSTPIKDIALPPIDVAIVIGNMLDNALEATSKISDTKMRTIDVYITQTDNLLIMTVVNPTTDDRDISSLKTTKDRPEFHGFGLLSIEQIVGKYNGELTLKKGNGVFTASVYMNVLKQA